METSIRSRPKIFIFLQDNLARAAMQTHRSCFSMISFISTVIILAPSFTTFLFMGDMVAVMNSQYTLQKVTKWCTQVHITTKDRIQYRTDTRMLPLWVMYADWEWVRERSTQGLDTQNTYYVLSVYWPYYLSTKQNWGSKRACLRSHWGSNAALEVL